MGEPEGNPGGCGEGCPCGSPARAGGPMAVDLAGCVLPVPRFRSVVVRFLAGLVCARATVSVAGVWFLASRTPACATRRF